MRRPSTVEVMLLTTIVLWSLNLTVSRYILTHGFQPLAYGVALVAVGSGSKVSGDAGGVLLGLVTAATWAGCSMAVTPLMSRYAARRIIGARTGASAGRCGRSSCSRRSGRSC